MLPLKKQMATTPQGLTILSSTLPYQFLEIWDASEDELRTKEPNITFPQLERPFLSHTAVPTTAPVKAGLRGGAEKGLCQQCCTKTAMQPTQKALNGAHEALNEDLSHGLNHVHA